jgi:alanine dehydrogenase
MTLVLNTEEVVQALDAKGYIEAMEEAFTELGRSAAINSPRTETGIPLLKFGTDAGIKTRAGELLRDVPENADAHQSALWMRAAKQTDQLNYRLKTIVGGYPKCGIMALKIDSTTDTNPSVGGMKRSVKLPLGSGWRYTGMMMLFDIVSGELQGILPLGPLQRNRVAATSAVGVKYLARKDARTLGLFGTGFQAEGQLVYAAQVRKLKQAKVYSPNAEHRRAFAEKMEKAVGIEVLPVEKPQEVCRDSDIVVSATTSLTPVFQSKWIDEGTHLGSINIVEADRASFTGCDLVVVNARPFAGGSSDLVRDYVMGKKMDTVGSNINKKSKKLNWKSMRELGELLTGKIKGRKNDNQITFHCNNIGLGVQHAATGARILANARRLGLGKEIPTDWFLQKEHT